MTCKYVCLRWNPSNAEAEASAVRLATGILRSDAQWQTIKSSGLRFMWLLDDRTPARLYSLEGGIGVIFGTLFRKIANEPCAPVDLLAPSEQLSIRSSKGKYLIEQFWGRYIAVICEPISNSTAFLRDPSGAINAYYVTCNSVELFFSDPAQLSELHGYNWRVDWQYVGRRLLNNRVQTKSTGLCDVQQLNAGECLIVTQEQRRTTLHWDPRQFTREDPLRDRECAAKELQTTTNLCVQTLASCYESIIHRLSGGLDSSIVLSCLPRDTVRPRVTCVNFVTPTREGNEVEYARLIAGHCSSKLIEITRQPNSVDLRTALPQPRTVTPALWLGEMEIKQYEAELAHEVRADAIFGGRGGDNVFYSGRSALLAADYLHDYGFTKKTFSVFRQAATLAKSSVWAVAGNVTTLAVRGRPPLGMRDSIVGKQLLHEELERAHNVEDFLHPWMRSDLPVCPGKYQQIETLVDLQNYYLSRNIIDIDNVYPLVCQPMMELCLRIPTYVLCNDGRDRALARQAFANQLPSKIVNRTSKGGTSGYVSQVVLQNLEFLREFLLDGILSSQGLLDRKKLEQNLTEARVVRDQACGFQITECFGIEAWARAWTGTRARAAA